jgi:para-aminobenzoate synthetase component 1
MWDGRPLDWQFDPLEALRRWPVDRPVLMLHSGRFDPRWARWSILAWPVCSYRFGVEGGLDRSRWIGPAPAGAPHFQHRPFRDLRHALQSEPEALWIGHLSYDLGRWIERVAARAADDRQWPVMQLGCCPGYLVHDGSDGRWRACGTWRDGGYPALDAAAPQEAEFAASGLRGVFTRDRYERAVERVIQYIHAGDVFQVNMTQRFTVDLRGSWPLAQRSLFGRLASVSPAWYGAYLEPAGGDGGPARAIASTSPELFLQVNAAGGVITRPIKGTRPAATDPRELAGSEKDQAELHMIVDLMRNDLGRVCDYGTVRVTQPRTVESHPTIHHGVATVQGRLHASCDVVDLLRATMPGGSITGAPKVHVMEIIEELEPVRRGPYCGAIGWLSARHGACLNIAIRTLLIQEGEADFSVGGGVVADSDPAAEYQETLDKAAAILRALGLDPPGGD